MGQLVVVKRNRIYTCCFQKLYSTSKSLQIYSAGYSLFLRMSWKWYYIALIGNQLNKDRWLGQFDPVILKRFMDLRKLSAFLLLCCMKDWNLTLYFRELKRFCLVSSIWKYLANIVPSLQVKTSMRYSLFIKSTGICIMGILEICW